MRVKNSVFKFSFKMSNVPRFQNSLALKWHNARRLKKPFSGSNCTGPDWNFYFLTKILNFDEKFDFGRKFWFWTKIFIFDQHIDFGGKFWLLPNILILDDFHLWPKFPFLLLPKILTFEVNFDFGQSNDPSKKRRQWEWGGNIGRYGLQSG